MDNPNISITLTDDDWYFILDSLNDRLKNLVDINTGDYGNMNGLFDDDIAQCERIMAVIEQRRVD